MIQILNSKEVSREEIFARAVSTVDVTGVCAEIIANVRARGDAALLEYSEKFDRVTLSSLEVTEAETEEALSLVEPEFFRILTEAAENIRAFHEKQVRNSFIINEKNGVVMGQKILPIERVGLYVPGGTARFSSPLSVDDFVKKSQYTYFTREALAAVAEDVAYFAEKEGLSAHARSAVSRFPKKS